MLITVFSDIFRSHDMGASRSCSGSIFVIFLPYLGVFVYLIARGHMGEHAIEAAQRADAARRRTSATRSGTSAGPADELDSSPT